MKTNIGFIHASPAAIPPLMHYYSQEAPDYRITNLLDDGVLRFFAAGNAAAAEGRIADMIRAARNVYGAELAMVTCSALSRSTMESLEAGAGVPVLKIDVPMSRRAVGTGDRIGVLVTFEPTEAVTRRLLQDAAERAGRNIEIKVRVIPDAYTALLSGDAAGHDRLLLEGVGDLDRSGVDCIVLAQVSMARAIPQAKALCAVPVFTSLETSLESVRAILQNAK